MFHRHRAPKLSSKFKRPYICRIFPAIEGGVIERQTKNKAVLPGLFILFNFFCGIENSGPLFFTDATVEISAKKRFVGQVHCLLQIPLMMGSDNRTVMNGKRRNMLFG